MARVRIDPAAIVANWRSFRALAPGCAIGAVLKADAYGLGADVAGRALAAAGANLFFTASLGEAIALRRSVGAGPEIFVLNGPGDADGALWAQAGALPVLNSMEQVALWAGRGPAALHIDTGMNRLGLSYRAPLGPALHALAQGGRDGALVTMVMSHLACAGDPASPMNQVQAQRFSEAASAFPSARKSLSATAGLQLGAAYHFDAARVGLGLYGAADRADGVPLRMAAQVTAPILQIRTLEPGDSVGYGAQFVAERTMRAATCAIGYADGFLRSLAPRGYGVLAGRRLALLGRVSMDLVVLDVTDCPEAAPGAVVEFLGDAARLDDVARAAGTIAYEVLTTLVGTLVKSAR